MKKNILKNITLDNREKIYKDFRKLNAKGYSCQMVLTTKRLIIYSHGLMQSRGRKTKQKRMNEIDLNTINRLEYYIEYLKNNIWIRLIGFLLFVGALAAGYYLYMGKINVPASIPFQPYIKYVASGVLAIIALIMIFNVRKTLYLIIEQINSKTTLRFDVNRYNETAIRYLASKIRPN